MDEIQLIDDALDGCYNLQSRISTLLAKLGEIKAEKNINYQIINLREKKSKSSSLSSSSSSSSWSSSKKVVYPKDRKKLIEYAKSIHKETGAAGGDAELNKKGKIDEKKINPLKAIETMDSEMSTIFTKLSDSFVEENADGYRKCYKKNILEKRLMNEKRRDLKSDDEEIGILANLSDLIVHVNAEAASSTRKRKTPTKSRWTKSQNFKDKKSQQQQQMIVAAAAVAVAANATATAKTEKNDMEKILNSEEDIELQNSSIAFDARSDDSGYCSGFRSLNEIKSTYAKIDKRFIDVKRSVESVAIRMKHVDEIINRQKGVFHITVQCAGGESFVCQH